MRNKDPVLVCVPHIGERAIRLRPGEQSESRRACELLLLLAPAVAGHALRLVHIQDEDLLAVTMSQIAEETGIGRATLYKYFPDVEAILFAWHDRQIASHLRYLSEVGAEATSPGGRLEAVLQAYALISNESRRHHEADLVGLLHRGERVSRAELQVHDMIRGLVTEAVDAGDVRDDISPDELASFCLSAIAGAAESRSKAAVGRLVAVTLSALKCHA